MSSLDLFNNLNSEFNKNESEKSQSDVTCENHFDKIPNEILSMIFEHLKVKDQKNLTKVCIRFKNLLFTSKSFTCGLKLKIDKGTRLTSFEDLPYNKISIDECESEKAHVTKRSKKILKYNEKTVKRLTIEYVNLKSVLDFITQVKNNLTILRLQSIDLNSFKKEIKVDLPNLTKLKLYDSRDIIKYIGEHKIEEMDIQEYSGNFEEHKVYDDFLKTANNLRKLILRNYLPTYDPNVHKYKIEYIVHWNNTTTGEKIKNFYKHHKESLKKLKIQDFVGDVVIYAINEMKVEELVIDDLSLSFESEFKPNHSIKKFKMIIAHDIRPIYEKIMSACKGVEDLTLPFSDLFSIPQNTLKVISENMKNLKHLTLSRMTSIIESLHFDKLETLKIKDVKSKDEHKSWISLAMCCPNLKKVFITQGMESDHSSGYSFTIASIDLKNLLNNSKNLQELHIGPHFDITDEFIETILNSESKSFWYLKIESLDFEEDGERAKKFEGTKIRCEVVRCYSYLFENDDDEV